MELLIVIVVIGILAAITIVAYTGISNNAKYAKAKSDIEQLVKAVSIARINWSKVLMQIAGSTATANSCVAKPSNTDLSALPKSDACWVDYLNALNAISVASGMNVRNMVDAWGSPYLIDENEGENGGCGRDTVALF